MKWPLPGALLAAALLAASQVQAVGFDRLGVPLRVAPDLLANPAALPAIGFWMRASMSEPFVDAAIREQRLDVHWAASHWAMAAQIDRQGSDIHARTTLGVALQKHTAVGVWGVAGAWEQWSFTDGALRQRLRCRMAWGGAVGSQVRVSLQVQPPLAPDDRAAVELLIGSSHLAPFRLAFHEQRTAGLPVARQFGVLWSDSNFSFGVGYNDATMATSIGIALFTGHWSWDASGTAHPYLGYGRQWGLALSP
jgi:hypothetical protein